LPCWQERRHGAPTKCRIYAASGTLQHFSMRPAAPIQYLFRERARECAVAHVSARFLSRSFLRNA
jgi:hypothetical protein